MTEEKALYPLEPPDRSSPRATLQTFVTSMNSAVEAFKRGRTDEARSLGLPAIQCLNLEKESPALRHFVGVDAALYLKEVLDRIQIPPDGEIPDAQAVETGHITFWTIPHTEISIGVAGHESPRRQFLFTYDTVKNAGKFYQKVKNLPYRPGSGKGALYEQTASSAGWIIPHALLSDLPNWARVTVLGQALWQWVGLALYIVLGLGAVFLIYKASGKVLDLLNTRLGANIKPAVLSLILGSSGICVVDS